MNSSTTSVFSGKQSNITLVMARWLLILLILFSAAFVIKTGIALWQQGKVDKFIADPAAAETVPDDPRAHFVQASRLIGEDKINEALDELTLVPGDADAELLPLTYYNRGNISLREALAMTESDARQIPLIELAKQDYRSALAVDPTFWDARYNLEVALRIVPEDPAIDPDFDKKIIDSERSIESKAFKVDLP